jgi:hypothetical protein
MKLWSTTARNVMGTAMENTTAASLGVVDNDDDFQKIGMMEVCCCLIVVSVFFIIVLFFYSTFQIQQ